MHKIILIEQLELVRKGLANCLQKNKSVDLVVASDADATIDTIVQMQPDLVILDGDASYHLLTAFIFETKRLFPAIKLFMLCSDLDSHLSGKSAIHEHSGCAKKDISCHEFIFAVESILSGRQYFSPEVTTILLNNKKNTDDLTLTIREQTVLEHVSVGLNNKQLANKLSISVRTVECHKRNIMRKLNLNSSAGLIRYGIQQGM